MLMKILPSHHIRALLRTPNCRRLLNRTEFGKNMKNWGVSYTIIHFSPDLSPNTNASISTAVAARAQIRFICPDSAQWIKTRCCRKGALGKPVLLATEACERCEENVSCALRRLKTQREREGGRERERQGTGGGRHAEGASGGGGIVRCQTINLRM